MKKSLLIAAVLCLSTEAYAAVPQLQQGKFVYLEPETGWTPKGFSESGIIELQNTAAQLKYPFYTIVINKLDCGEYEDTDACAARTIDNLAEVFQQNSFFDVQKSSIFILSYSPRKFRFLAGAKWKNELGFERNAHKPYTDIFAKSVRGTPKDPQGGIIAMMKAVDAYLVDATDPAKIAARLEAKRVAEQQLALQNAEASLDTEINRLSALLLEHDFLPANATQYTALLGDAETVRNRDNPNEMASKTASMKTDVDVLDSFVSEKLSQYHSHMIMFLLKALASAIALILLLAFSRRRYKFLNLCKDKFDKLFVKWDNMLSNAEVRYVTFQEQKTNLMLLSRCVGETIKLYDSVADEVDHIYLSVQAIREHLKACKELEITANFFSLRPALDALTKINSEFEFDTGQVNTTELFGNPNKTITVSVTKFANELEERFNKAMTLYNLLSDADKAQSSNPKELLPVSMLTSLRTKLIKNKFADGWLKTHPLINADALYTELEALKTTDPVLYLERIKAVKDEHERIASTVDELCAISKEITRVTVEFTSVPEGTIVDDGDNPVLTLATARHSLSELSAELEACGDLSAVKKKTDDTVNLFKKVRLQERVIADAIDTASKSIDKNLRKKEDLDKRLSTVESALMAAQKYHDVDSCKAAKTGFDIAARTSDIIDRDITTAKELLLANKHVQSQKLSNICSERLSTTEALILKTGGEIKTLNKLKQDYEARLASMKESYANKKREAARYGRTLRHNEWDNQANGMLNYAILLTSLNTIERSWDSDVHTARYDYEQEQERATEAARSYSSSSNDDYSSSSGDSWSSSDSSSSSGGDW